MTTIESPLPTAPSGRLVTADGRELPLRGLRLQGHAAAGLARVRVLQTFTNPFAEPLQVTYQLPLPAEAAVGAFCFRIGERTVRGEIDRREAARERFEQAIAEGRTAGLLEQDRAALFTQQIGNLPPGAELQAEIDVDQPLVWQDGGWEWRFPTTVAPRYLGGAGRVPDAGRIEVDVVDPAGAPPAPRCELEFVIGDAGAVATSPSHALAAGEAGAGIAVRFAAAGGRVAMDRDVVLRWAAAGPAPGVGLRTGRSALPALGDAAFGLLTLVPPALPGVHLARDLVVMLDISGSMQGEPLDQGRAVVGALVDSLGEGDRLELMAFAGSVSCWGNEPRAVDAAAKADARRWLAGLRAGGGTEMFAAIRTALAVVRQGAQRQLVLVTDGQIGFEAEIVGAIRNQLAGGTRVHVVGVGSAPNRSLTRGASRAGRGREVLLGRGDDAAPMAARLVAATAAPLVDALELDGDALLAAAPRALPDLFAGSPARLAVRLRPEGGLLRVRGRTAAGPFVHELRVAPANGPDADGELLARWFGREAVEDLETEVAAGAGQRLDGEIERLGLEHHIATRRTSWVAIDEQPSVDGRAPFRSVRVPHELPEGMAVEMLGLRGAGGFASGVTLSRCESRMQGPAVASPVAKSLQKSAAEGLGSILGRWLDALRPGSRPAAVAVLRRRSDASWWFQLRAPAAWQLPIGAVVVFADGREVELQVDPVASSTPGAVPAGALVRLALVGVPGLASAVPVSLRLVSAAGTVTLPIVIP